MNKISRLKKLNFHDYGHRDFAILYINGEFIEGLTHTECLQEYLEKNNVSSKRYRWREDAINSAKDDIEVNDYAFLSYVQEGQGASDDKKGIYISSNDIYGITLDELVKKVKNKYPNMDIFDDDKYDEDYNYIQLSAGLKNIAYHHDVNCRQNAILYINGEFIEGDTHSECLNMFYAEHKIEDGSGYYRDHVNKSLQRNDYIITEYAFMHNVGEDDTFYCDNAGIYIETESITGITLSELIAKIKQHYPNVKIFNDDVVLDDYHDVYERIAKIILKKNIKLNKKLKKLLKENSFHDYDNRDLAIMFINDKFYEATYHSECLQQFYNQNNISDNVEKDILRTDVEDNMGDNIEKIKNFAFMHKVGNNIYIETNSEQLYGIDLNELITRVKEHYPNCEIYDEDSVQWDDEDDESYKRIASNKKIGVSFISHDIDTREKAILYIDGELIEAPTHKDALDIYIEKYKKSLLTKNIDDDNKYRTNYVDDVLNANLPLAFINYVSSDDVLDEQPGLYIETSEIFNTTLETVIRALKEKYPNEKIFDDDNVDNNGDYRKLAKVSSYENSIKVMVYIDGKIYEDKTYLNAIDNYIQEQIKKLNMTEDDFLSNINNLPMAFAYYIGNNEDMNNRGIYIETSSMNEVSLSDFIKVLKEKYPNEKIYDDNDDNRILSAKIKKTNYIMPQEYIIPGTPLYPQDYFKQRDPKRLKNIKEIHDKGKYLNFEFITEPTMTK